MASSHQPDAVGAARDEQPPFPGVDTILVVPCFNEEARLDTSAFAAAVGAYPWLGFLFVDDGSTDGTAGVLERFCASPGHRARWVRLQRNSGKAEAVRAGLLEAFGWGTPHLGYWDADLATPLSEAAAFRQDLLDHPDRLLVMGSRVQLMGRDIRRSARRHYAGRVFATAAALSLGISVYDTQCGAKLLRNAPGLQHVFDAPFRTRWVFDVEILARIRSALGGEALDRRVAEIPLRRWEDVGGSKLTLAQMLGATLDLLRLRTGGGLRSEAPLSPSGPPG